MNRWSLFHFKAIESMCNETGTIWSDETKKSFIEMLAKDEPEYWQMAENYTQGLANFRRIISKGLQTQD